MKFSIVVPVYNVEKYVEKCLASLNNQTYKNYEAIIVNDGSTDDSESIIKRFIKNKKNFKYYKKENGGLSDARNFGVKYSSGNYLLFLDSDDYLDEELLERLCEILSKNKYDIIKFNYIDVINEKCIPHYEPLADSIEVQVKDLINFEYFEPAHGFCYDLNFYKNNNFEFAKGKYHEDYGLIPLILLKANTIYYYNYFGYYYVKRENSIVNNQKNIFIRVKDIYDFSIDNIKKIERDTSISEENKKAVIHFYANGAIQKLRVVDNRKEYLIMLKKNKLYNYLLDHTIKQKIKKIVCMINYKLYIYLF